MSKCHIFSSACPHVFTRVTAEHVRVSQSFQPLDKIRREKLPVISIFKFRLFKRILQFLYGYILFAMIFLIKLQPPEYGSESD